jgi:glycosyltransferase involved in cell wall biosynthesis
MKLGVIIQRYGTEVLGGSEHLCRLVAERLAAQHEVDVLTTCARDYQTWKNEYAEGSDRIRGVTVRRFANAATRDLEAFNKYSDWIYHNPHSRHDEMEWLKQQGPWCPGLIEYLRRHQQEYDVLLFFTYLYAPTVVGLEVNPGKSVLVSTAHDEPAIKLEIFREVFARPAAICYLTESERQFVQGQFVERPLLEDVIGVGVDLPQQQPYPRMPPPPEEEDQASVASGDVAGWSEPVVSGALAGSGEPAGTGEPGGLAGEDDTGARDYPSHLLSRGSVFRRRHRLHGPVVLYGGRIDPGKGCEELIEYFSGYVKEGGDATLALMGVKMMALPEEPFIRFAGLLSDAERLQALEAATVVVCPSPYESLSLLALEALSVGTPILANARSAVLVEHCVKSNGGLYYADRDEFVECLKVLTGDAWLRASLGRNGRDYVRRNYRWDVVLGKYERIFAKVRNAR